MSVPEPKWNSLDRVRFIKSIFTIHDISNQKYFKSQFRAWRRPPDPAGVEALNLGAYRQPNGDMPTYAISKRARDPSKCLFYRDRSLENCRQTLGESL